MTAPVEALRAALKSVFGFAAFRPGQEEILAALTAGEDAFIVMPTGGGKSLCYQLPAIVRGGLTVVVSPLIALMRNQVQQLKGLGIEAASLTSASTSEEAAEARAALTRASLRLLYLAPERIAKPEVQTALRKAGLSMLAIDEAHCVSQWGHDFRPEYLTLGAIREALGSPQLVALTATADAPTRKDIVEKLFPRPPRIFVRSFDRPNLRLAMAAKHDAWAQIGRFLETHEGESGIVYCGTRKATEETAARISMEGPRCLAYHAGMEHADRTRNQDIFLQEDGVVMAATVAFGMGIDKPDVRFVVHADMPRNIESYYQEIGRAGRDGLSADTLTLYGLDDMRLCRSRIDMSELSSERKLIERQRFNALVALCEAPRCRRQTLLAYFGEASEPCGNCDLCQAGVEVADGTVEAQKFMSAMVRTGERFATEHLIAILTGKATDAVLRFGHEKLPTFGVGQEHGVNAWRSIARQLYAAGAINLDITEHGRWTLTPVGREVLQGRRRIEIRKEAVAPRQDRGTRRKARAVSDEQLADGDRQLLGKLKELRTRLAREQQVPAYVVFSDRTLIEMARQRPRTFEALQSISGVGKAKLARYGQSFLDLLGNES